MRGPNIINTAIDTIIAIDNENVIDDTTQTKITAATIQVDIRLLNLTSGASSTVTNKTMTRDVNADFYTIAISDISTLLTNKTGYVGLITENGVTNNMRDFKIDGFAIDDEYLEDTMMALPYRVFIDSGECWIEWHEDTTWTNLIYKAQGYEGGTGTTYATLPERVTHRGPIVKV